MSETWISGDPYEYFMGRWSRLMAPEFLEWVGAPYNLSWLDLGCGTGALSEAIYNYCQPAMLSGVDPSAGFLEKARERLSGRGDFTVGSSTHIPKADNSFDIVVSGLALNFFPDLPAAFSEMKRVLKSDGIIAAYVWDYADRMEFLRIFWEVASQLDPEARKLDEGIRFPLCKMNRLKEEFQKAGFSGIETSFLEIPTVFSSFEDYWNPFLGGQGPAPGYLASLDKQAREELKTSIRAKLPVEPDGSIKLIARALAVRGVYTVH